MELVIPAWFFSYMCTLRSRAVVAPSIVVDWVKLGDDDTATPQLQLLTDVLPIAICPRRRDSAQIRVLGCSISCRGEHGEKQSRSERKEAQRPSRGEKIIHAAEWK